MNRNKLEPIPMPQEVYGGHYMTNIAERLDGLRQLMDDLAERVSPILRESEKQIEKEFSERAAGRSPLGEKAVEILETVAYIEKLAIDLYERIDV